MRQCSPHFRGRRRGKRKAARDSEERRGGKSKKRDHVCFFVFAGYIIFHFLFLQAPERWLSGRRRRSRKPLTGYSRSGVRIPLSPPFLRSNSGILPHFFPIFRGFFLKKSPRSCILCRNLSCRLDQYDHESPKKRTHPTNERITRQTEAKDSGRALLL